MTINQVLTDTCQRIVSGGAGALEAQQAEKVGCDNPSMVLSMEMAELHNINDMVTRIVEGVRPLWRALGIRMILKLDTMLPLVQVMVQPTEEALSVALDLCISKTPDVIVVQTRVIRNRVVATIEGSMPASEIGIASVHTAEMDSYRWCEVSSMGRVELVVGDRISRALGGHLRMQQREGSMRFRLELPIITRPHCGWLAGFRTPEPINIQEDSFRFPNTESDRRPFSAVPH